MTPQNGWVTALIHWYEKAKRDLPWRRTRDPYAVWISEIMLQQTRVEAVIGYYNRFLLPFPTVHALADAPEEAVLKAWEGLGYYSRARNMHKAAKIVSGSMHGAFPNTSEKIRKLPGIGNYTAGAIASIAFGEAVPAVDGNVKRVASRLFGIRENIDRPSVIRDIRAALTQAIPEGQASAFNQALMELGATVCIPRAPRCKACPVRHFCDARAAGDADSLPVIEPKKPPVTVNVAVCLLTYGKAILLFKRGERLLRGLYV
ncbi:MAG: A/G-specific adenine glycosylase, partial [Bacillota bacterium]